MSRPQERIAAVQVHGVIVTFRRPRQVSSLLNRLEAQDRPLDTLVVVDNDPDPANQTVVAEFARRGTPAVFLASPENLGPAGGLEAGMRHILGYAADDDWIVLFDDDNHELTQRELADLLSFATERWSHDQRTAGVGQRGAEFSWTTGRARLGVEGSAVDSLGGNGFPMYRVAAVREVGPFAGELFFGLDDLEYGLRLRAHGYSLYKAPRPSGPFPMPARRPPTRRRLAVEFPNWRRYYSLRNLVLILRRYGHSLTAARISLSRGLLKPLLSLPFAPRAASRHLSLNSLALRDAWTGRIGRRVEPSSGEYGPPSSARTSAPTTP